MGKRNIKMGKLPVMDIRSQDNVPAFEDLISKGPMTIILVYADWCGHCDRFKENIWKPLKNTSNRTMNMASVHYDQLENTSLKESKINGYPSLLVVGTDKEPASFDSESGMTNAMPNTNDLTTMKRIVTTPINNMKPKNNSNTYMETPKTENTSRSMVKANITSTRTSNNNLRSLNNVSTINAANENMNSLNNINQTTIATTNADQLMTPPNTFEDTVVNAYESNVNSIPLINRNELNSELNNGLNSELNNGLNSNTNSRRNRNVNTGLNSGVEINTSRNIPRNTQGTTPILSGGRLYKKLSMKNRKPSRKSRSKSPKKTRAKRKN